MKKDKVLEGLLAAYDLVNAWVPKGSNYLEKGLLQRALCEQLELHYETVKTDDFEAAVKKAKEMYK